MIRRSALGLGVVLLLIGPMVAPLRCGPDPVLRRARETHRVAKVRVESSSARRAK